ncbi:MAG: ATP-binding protein [Candidatus Micrarchaeales archaeon]
MLEKMNPWWEEKNWESLDADLKKFNTFKIKWLPLWIKDISLKPPSLNFVLGPRQVGKTTGIKLLIKQLIEKGEDPKLLAYINCDLLASFKELRSIMEKMKGYKLIVLDEVTSIEYWWKVVKGLIDLGQFTDSTLIVSGSSSLRVEKFMEAFSGRRGYGKDVVVLPLSFKEFVEVKKYKKSELFSAFEHYLKSGGYPRSINEDQTFLQDFISSIEKEFARVGKSYKLGREIIYQIILKAPSALGYNTIGNSIGVSHVTVREYLEIMEDMFLLKIAHLKDGDKINFRKEKKIFLRDPFMLQAFSTIFGIEPRKEIIYEWVIQEHIFRKFGEIFYWKNKFEIDCIAKNLKVEVKAGKAHERYPKNVIVLDEEEIPKFLIKL